MLNVPTYQSTWHQNLARHTSEARYPHLWKSIRGNWQPGLGPTGLTLHDLSGRGNNGTLTLMDPATDWVQSDGRWALDFDGTNEYVSISHNINLFPITLAAWVKLNVVSGQQTIMSYADQAAPAINKYYRIATDGNDWRLQCVDSGNNPNIVSPGAMVDTDWHYIVGVVTGTDGIKLYVDGDEVASTATNATQLVSPDLVSLGIRALGNEALFAHPLNGKTDDAYIQDGIVSPNAIRQFYQLGRGGWLARRRRVFAKAPAAPTGVTIPVLDHHYRQMRAA